MKHVIQEVWQKRLVGLVLLITILSIAVPTPPDTAQAGEDPLTGLLSEIAKQLSEEAIKRLFQLAAGIFKDKDVYFSKEDPYLFFEGNGCTQQVVGSMWTSDMNVPGEPTAWNAKKVGWMKNDEARSLLIKANTKAPQTLTVYDNPGGSQKDDWTRITILRDLPEPYCVGSFEVARRDQYVLIEWHRHNGLDGKISRVENGSQQPFSRKLFWRPTHRGYRIDVCFLFGEFCEIWPADTFCQEAGYVRAVAWSVEPEIGAQSPTIMLGSEEICNQWFCSAFKTITCGAPSSIIIPRLPWD